MYVARLLPLLLVAASLLLAGCGGADKNAYVKENNAIQEQAMTAVSKLDPSANPKEAAAQFTTAKKALDDAAKDLDALEVPADWQNEHDDLVKSIEGMSVEVEKLSVAVKAKDVKAMTASSVKLNTLQADASKAIDAMNADR